MKKLFLAMSCFMGLMFFASCDPETINELMEQKPTVEFVAADGYISANTSVYVGTELNFKVKVAPNSGSESPLANFNFAITNLEGTTVLDQNPTLTTPGEAMTFEFTYLPETASNYVVTATVTDEAGKADVVAITVDCTEPVIAEIGTFQGILNINGTVSSDGELIPGTGVISEDLDISDIATTLVLGSTSEDRVNVTIDLDGTPVTLQATVDGNTYIFDEFHFSRSINLITDITLDLIVNMTGVMDGDTMALSGTVTGTGSVVVLFTTVHVVLDGNIEGTLEKVEE